MFGPDVTFLGVPRCDLDDPSTVEGADVVIIGAPYDAGTSYRAGARFGPKMIRTTDYLDHDASRPHLALRVDPLRDMRVLDAGDILMPGVEGKAALDALEKAVQTAATAGAIPLVLGGDQPSPGRTSRAWRGRMVGDAFRSSTSTLTPTRATCSTAA